jgi:hypothetical protein
MWLINTIQGIAARIAENRERLLSERVGRSPRHILSGSATAKSNTVTEVARIAVESAESTASGRVNNEEQPNPIPPQRAGDSTESKSTGAAPAA